MNEGHLAPDFTLKDSFEKEVTLSQFKGKNVVLYFYPKDNTPGCTIEAIDFSALKSEFEKENAVIFGISKDNCKSHQKFTNDQKLTITLLSDPDSSVQKQFGVWGKKKFMGKEFIGTIRSTFLIDTKGIIRKIWSPVSVKNHAKEVLEEIKNIRTN